MRRWRRPFIPGRAATRAYVHEKARLVVFSCAKPNWGWLSGGHFAADAVCVQACSGRRLVPPDARCACAEPTQRYTRMSRGINATSAACADKRHVPPSTSKSPCGAALNVKAIKRRPSLHVQFCSPRGALHVQFCSGRWLVPTLLQPVRTSSVSKASNREPQIQIARPHHFPNPLIDSLSHYWLT